MRFRKPNELNQPRDTTEEISFNSIMRTPDDAGSASIQTFIRLRDVMYDRANLSPIADVLDGDGQLIFETNYYIDSESAIRANIRKIRFEIYLQDPAGRTASSNEFTIGTRDYINSSIETALGGSRRTLGRGLTGTVRTKNSPIKTFDVDTGITDQHVAEFRQAEIESASAPRPDVVIKDPLQTVTLSSISQSRVGDVSKKLSQTYSALIVQGASDGGALSTTTTAQAVNQTKSQNLGSTSQFSNTAKSTQQLSQEALKKGDDPSRVANFSYNIGGTAYGGASTKSSTKYSGSPRIMPNFQNEVSRSTKGLSSDDGYANVRSESAQRLTTQQAPKLEGKTELSLLYEKLANIQDETLLSSKVQQVVFESTLKEFQNVFDLSFRSCFPKTQKMLWIRCKLLDRHKFTYKEKIFTVDLSRQLRSHLIPSIPPAVKVISHIENRVELELVQRDPLATNISIYRMVCRPEELAYSEWEKVTELDLSVRSGPTKYVDEDLSANVEPNLVWYEVRCAGLFGTICPSTSRIIEKGVKRAVGVVKNKSQKGTCAINARKDGNSMLIELSELPSTATRVFLKKQHYNTALRKNNSRDIPFVPPSNPESPGLMFYSSIGSQSTYAFIDKNVVDREIYRYFAQFEWSDYPQRTDSISDIYAEYIVPPSRPIISYLRDLTSGLDDRGRPAVSFVLAASFSDFGLDELNRILREAGVDQIFAEELLKDRSLVSNLLSFQVTRKNNRTLDTVVWPLVQEGIFVDSVDTQARARLGASSGALRPGVSYTYTARLYIINPERFFREALTRIPAATRQNIKDTNPDFAKVSARRFAENFALAPGTILSPTTYDRPIPYSEEVQGANTGILHNTIISIPLFSATVKDVSAQRNAAGRIANVVRWKTVGPVETVNHFRIDITVDRNSTVPLCSVTPNVSDDGQYEFRDYIYVEEILPVSYSVTVVYNDFRESSPAKSNEIFIAATTPPNILYDAKRKEVTKQYSVDLSLLNPNAVDSRNIFDDAESLAAKNIINPNSVAGPSFESKFAEETSNPTYQSRFINNNSLARFSR